MLRILRILGDSMSPEFKEKDFAVIGTMSFFSRRLRAGDTIVFTHQHYGTLIKRIQRIDNEGVYVIGAHENSLDSRRLGPIEPAKIQGRVIWHIRRS